MGNFAFKLEKTHTCVKQFVCFFCLHIFFKLSNVPTVERCQIFKRSFFAGKNQRWECCCLFALRLGQVSVTNLNFTFATCHIFNNALDFFNE